MRIAAIDIGTVTTRLLIASRELSSATVVELYREIDITQLGQGVSSTGMLPEQGITAVLFALEKYVRAIERFQVEKVYCVATSALRDAGNAKELVDAAESLGISIEVISGEEEARLAFCGASYGLDASEILLLDIGGGSTELVLGSIDGDGRAEVKQLTSLQLGSRRLTDLFMNSDPPSADEIEAARAHVREMLLREIKGYQGEFDQLVAVAGTATTLVAVLGEVDPYDPAKVQGCTVNLGDVDALLSLFLSKTLEARRQIVGLEPKRADVIIAGTLILEAALDILDCQQFTVSDRDLLYGIVLSATNEAL